LLLGHGWLNLIEKPGLMYLYKTLGLDAAATARYAGIFEMSAVCLILIFPYRPFILVIFVWKISSELFYPRYNYSNGLREAAVTLPYFHFGIARNGSHRPG
jgi:hypothetical protein